mgnify:CR=1 FL=1
MSSIWDKLKESFSDVFEKAEELTHLGQEKIEILQLKNKMAKEFSKMGIMIYEKYIKDKGIILNNDKKFKESVKELKKMEKTLKEKEKKIADL